MEARTKSYGQILWGVLLVLAGLGLIVRIPVIIPEIETVKVFSSDLAFKRISLYIIAAMLVGGGGKKIVTHYKMLFPKR